MWLVFVIRIAVRQYAGPELMWTFRERARGEKIRNPIQGEFFATDAIRDPAQALVRESIQNSLDASTHDGPVRMRFFLCRDNDALKPSRIADYFSGSWEHYRAPGNGLREPPTRQTSCDFLTIEDFGTKGLTGDVDQDQETPGVVNPFFLFFRAEGLSAKAGMELGRWGIGKFVFPRSSMASTHFGVTVRHDDKRRLLMGAATLKAHTVNSTQYTPDGLFGMKPDEGFVRPIADPRMIDAFSEVFGITRRSEPGLSVVVPFLDREIAFASILRAVVCDYFVPVVRGHLEVEVATPTEKVILTTDTFDEVLAKRGAEIGDDALRLASLARWASVEGAGQCIKLAMPEAGLAARWSEALVPEPSREEIRIALETRKRVAVRAFVIVREKGKEARTSHFDMYVEADELANGSPLFVREGIVISDARGKRSRGMRSLVLIEDRPLASLLGDSENPAHTQWQKESSNFRHKYTYGPGVIEFVTQSVQQLLAIVNRSSDKPDPSLTIDFFSIPCDSEDETGKTIPSRPRRSHGPETPAPRVDVETRPTRVRISKHVDGFNVGPGSAPPDLPYLLEVRCAYETRAGNPIRKWHPADFDVCEKPISVVCQGAVRVARMKGNSIMLAVTGAEYGLSVRGFDAARDLYVRADVREVRRGDSQD